MIVNFLVRVQETEPDWSGDQKILLMGNYATKDEDSPHGQLCHQG